MVVEEVEEEVMVEVEDVKTGCDHTNYGTTKQVKAGRRHRVQVTKRMCLPTSHIALVECSLGHTQNKHRGPSMVQVIDFGATSSSLGCQPHSSVGMSRLTRWK